MTIDTISFQELLGHYNQIYKQNEVAVVVLEDRLKEYGGVLICSGLYRRCIIIRGGVLICSGL